MLGDPKLLAKFADWYESVYRNPRKRQSGEKGE